MSNSYYDTTPKPNADFTNANRSHNTVFTYIGLDANKDSITHIGVSAAPMYEGEKESGTSFRSKAHQGQACMRSMRQALRAEKQMENTREVDMFKWV